MWEGVKQFPIQLGGLDENANPAVAYPSAIEALNVRYGERGSVKLRTGFTALSGVVGANENIDGIFPLQLSTAGSGLVIIACTKTKVYSQPYGAGAESTLGTGFTLGSTVGDHWDADILNDEMILVNGYDAPQATDGATMAALVVQSSTQVRTAMTTAQVLSYGLHTVGPATLIAAVGQSSAATYDSLTQEYDTIGDVWATRQRASVVRQGGAGFCVDGQVYVTCGNTTGAALTTLCGRYDPDTDTYNYVQPVTARRESVGAAANNGGFSITGNDNAGASAWVTGNLYHDPATNTWGTRAAFSTDPARRASAGFVIAQNPHVISGRITPADAYDAEHGEYDPDSNVWTDKTDLTAARAFAGGVQGQDNLGYVVGGMNSSDADQTTIYSYNAATDAWATSSAPLSTARNTVGCASDDWMMYIAGGSVGSTPSAIVERYNASPAPPVAKYVKVYKDQVLMARSSAYPSRVWYSAPGNARVWEPFSYFDVAPDDGRWITGMFVYEGNLYVSKTNVLYLISGDAPFHPVDAIPTPVSLDNIRGTTSHRSVVVTDQGVFYMADDGIRKFDGSSSTMISGPVNWYNADANTTGMLRLIAGVVNCIGVWNREYGEIIFAVNGSTGVDEQFVYNIKQNKWSKFDTWNIGSAFEARVGFVSATVLLFTRATEGVSPKVYEMSNTAFTDDGAAITAAYQTGWFSPTGGTDLAMPKDLFLWCRRGGGSTAVSVSLRANYSASDPTEGGVTFSDTLSAGFEDSTDQRCRISCAAASTSHAMSMRITASTGQWELYGAVLTYVTPLADGGFPT